MPENPTLTVTELKPLLLAHFGAKLSRQMKLQARLQQELGKEIQEIDSQYIAIMDKLLDWLSGLLAHRLRQNQHTTPLLSSQDFTQFVLLEVFPDFELGAVERKTIKRFLDAVLENIVELLMPGHPDENLYEKYWQWVTTVLDLAVERGISPTELLTLETTADEITRRTFSREQYIATLELMTAKLTDIDTLMKLNVQPRLAILSETLSEEERSEIEQRLESKLMPQLREQIDRVKVILRAFLDEEVERIYGVM